MRKRIVIAISGFVLAGVVAFAAMPLLALSRLRSGLEARDPARVAPLVDFPTLRVNVKASTERKIEHENEGRFLEFARNWIGRAVADDVLDRVTTPEGLIRLTCDKQTDGDLSAARGKPCVLTGALQNLSYPSSDRFRVDVLQSDGQRIALVMGRHGLLDWRLVNVIGAGPKP